MARSSQKLAAKANLLRKRKREDGFGLKNKSILKRHKKKSEEATTKEQKIEASVELSETMSDEANLISESAAEPAEPKKTVFVDCLPPKTKISDIIDFFKDVGQVVRVRLEATYKGNLVDQGFVEFASSNQAKKVREISRVLEKKKDESLHNRKICLDVANKGTRYLTPKYCIDHKVWYEENYLQQQESLSIKNDESPPNSVKEASVLFVANLSPQTTKISHIIYFFKDVGDVVSVRLIVDHKGKHVGYGFVEFASAHQAKKALEHKNGEYLHDHKIFLMKGLDETPDFAEVYLFLMKGLGEYLHNREISLGFVKTDAYPSQTKYCIDHKVWYEEDYLQQEESLMIEDAAVQGLDETPDFVEDVALREKTVFVDDLSMKKDALCNISYIINLFKDVGEVVRVRLIVDHSGEHVGCCFVEFASTNEAKKAVQEKNGRKFFVNVAEIDLPYPFRPKYKLAEKLWYEDNLRREGFGLPNKSKLKKELAMLCRKEKKKMKMIPTQRPHRRK